MKKLLFAISFSILAMAFNEAKAQGVGEFAYQVSFPTGDFKNFASKVSWLGFSGQYRWLLNNKRVSVGGSLNWFYFVDKQGTQTVDMGEKGTYHGFVTDFTNIYSLLGVVQYDLKDPKEKVVPFIRAGAGIAYQDQRKDVGIFEVKGDGAQFAWNAEIGIRTMRQGSGLLLALTYHGLPKSGNLIATSYVGIKLGFTRYPY